LADEKLKQTTQSKPLDGLVHIEESLPCSATRNDKKNQALAELDVLIGRRIRHRRWFLGISQPELGDMVGVSFQQIQKYETGRNRVSASTLWRVADALNCDIDFFFQDIANNQLKQRAKVDAATTYLKAF
jgi:DNA-binding XRE family transcriptional regulator